MIFKNIVLRAIGFGFKCSLSRFRLVVSWLINLAGLIVICHSSISFEALG